MSKTLTLTLSRKRERGQIFPSPCPSLLCHFFCIDLRLLCGTEGTLCCATKQEIEMRIAKPLLLITTPIGVVGAIYEAYRLAGGLVFLMVALMGLIGVAMATLVMTIRKEAAAEARRLAGEPTLPRKP